MFANVMDSVSNRTKEPNGPNYNTTFPENNGEVEILAEARTATGEHVTASDFKPLLKR